MGGMYLELSFDLGSLDPQAAEEAAFACGACAVTFVDARDDPVLEPAPGELRLWPATRVKCLFTPERDRPPLPGALGASLGVDPALIDVQRVVERAWEREWLRDSHARRFGRRLWVRPHHERVSEPGAIVVALDPGMAFGTGTHASTALCLAWLDARLTPGARVIDYGCGSGVLALAAAKLGARAVHCFDIDPQALVATRANARANRIASRVHLHDSCATLPGNANVLLANILVGTLCALTARFASLLRHGGEVVLAGLMEPEAAYVTDTYAACFDVARFGDRDGWVCLAGRRR
jgi:ribosomal protein L11 methyltransferase